jgi:hypothetical protein
MSGVLVLGSEVGSTVDMVAALAGSWQTPFDAKICVPRQFWKLNGYETGKKEQEAEGHSLDNSRTGIRVHGVQYMQHCTRLGERRRRWQLGTGR